MNYLSLKTPSLVSILSHDQHIILYRPELRKITGSVTATILLQQMLYRWDNHGKEPFYKFKEPCNHQLYRDGDSWCEELEFSKFEFDNALKKIGFKRTGQTRGVENTEYPIEYWTDLNRLTHYTIIEEILEKKLMEVYGIPNDSITVSPELTKIKKLDLPVKRETGFTSITETTTKITTLETTPQGVDLREGPSSSFSKENLKTLMEAVPQERQSQQVDNRLTKALIAGFTVAYLLDCLAYSDDKANGNFLAYLGNCIDKGYAPDGYHQAKEEARRRQKATEAMQEQENQEEQRTLSALEKHNQRVKNLLEQVDMDALDDFIGRQNLNKVDRQRFQQGKRAMLRRQHVIKFLEQKP